MEEIRQNPSHSGSVMHEKLIRIKSVIEVTGKSRSAIYADIAKGTFPKPVAIGARAVAWPLSEISAWVQQQIVTARS